MADRQNERVKAFFDEIAADYALRYAAERPFLRFFHLQRMKAAVSGRNFSGKKIWDIGAGTAALRRFLLQKNGDFQYFASDISPEMQLASGLSPSVYHVGKAADAPADYINFSAVFLLGVTTYLEKSEAEKLFTETLPQRTADDTHIFVTFTHKSGLDFRLRRFLKKFSFLFPANRCVGGQKFSVRAYTVAEVFDLLAGHFEIEKIIFLNQTFPLFNRIFPALSVRLAKYIFTLPDGFFKRWLSSDFLVIAAKKS